MFTITSAQLKMFAAVCSNLVVAFLLAILATKDVRILTTDIVGAILFWKLGVKAEGILEGI